MLEVSVWVLCSAFAENNHKADVLSTQRRTDIIRYGTESKIRDLIHYSLWLSFGMHFLCVFLPSMTAARSDIYVFWPYIGTSFR